MTRKTLVDDLRGRITAKSVDRILDRLRSGLLVWDTPEGLRLVAAAVEAVPWRVGRAPETDAFTREELDQVLAELNPAQRSILDTLARTSPIGRTRDAAPGSDETRPVQKLLRPGCSPASTTRPSNFLTGSDKPCGAKRRTTRHH